MDSTAKAALAKEIYDTCHLTGNFVLRSGRVTNEYFDKYRLSAKSPLLFEITKNMAKLIPEGTEVIAGLEMGAMVVFKQLCQFS